MKVISKSALPDLDYTFNPYIGCAHGCVYCYARCFTRDREASNNWGKVVKVKPNVLDSLKRELRSVRKGAVIGVSTITDPYQPIESKARIVREAVRLMLEAGLHVSIQTKSNLVVRDLDVLEGRKADVGFTITTMDERIARMLEPNAPSPRKRAEALKKVAKKGLERWIFYGPIVPYLTDDDETALKIAELALETETGIILDYLRLRPKIIKSMKEALGELGEKVINAARNRAFISKRLAEIRTLMEKKGLRVSFAFPQTTLSDFLRQ